MDTLLLLHRDPSRWWSADQIASTLILSSDVVAVSLEALAGRNLLDVRVGSTLTYCFSPIKAHLFDTLSEIAADPLAVREMVLFSSPKVPRTEQA